MYGLFVGLGVYFAVTYVTALSTVATAFLVLFVGWEWALVKAVEGQLAGWIEIGLYAGLILVFVLAMAVVWIEFSRIDNDRD